LENKDEDLQYELEAIEEENTELFQQLKMHKEFHENL
jgi:hypothetical protein